MPSTPSTEQLRLISDAARALEKADPCNGDRGRIVARLAETLNRSLNTTYNYLKKYGAWESGKKPRKGKGETCAQVKTPRIPPPSSTSPVLSSIFIINVEEQIYP